MQLEITISAKYLIHSEGPIGKQRVEVGEAIVPTLGQTG